jgi:hypothetical protein
VTGKLKEDIAYANHVFYGKNGADFKMEKHRICWYVPKPLQWLHEQYTNNHHRDAFTTSSDFIISPHAAAKGLYIATGGNFHGFKFFPVLGKYIVDMLEGGLSPELMNKWAWDRERPDPCMFADYPRHEMNDFDDPVRTSRL